MFVYMNYKGYPIYYLAEDWGNGSALMEQYYSDVTPFHPTLEEVQKDLDNYLASKGLKNE